MSVPKSEFSEQFIEYMKNRMETSYAKYGAIADVYPDKISAIESGLMRIDKYIDTGNTEWLVDAANFMMIEFMHPSHDEAHFRATEAKESPGRFIKEGGKHNDAANEDL